MALKRQKTEVIPTAPSADETLDAMEIVDIKEMEVVDAETVIEAEEISEEESSEELTGKETSEEGLDEELLKNDEEGDMVVPSKYNFSEEKLDAYLASSKEQDKIIQISRTGNFVSAKDHTIYVPITLFK